MTSGAAGKIGPDRANATLCLIRAGSKGTFTAVAVASTILGAVPVGVDGNNVIDALFLVSRNDEDEGFDHNGGTYSVINVVEVAQSSPTQSTYAATSCICASSMRRCSSSAMASATRSSSS